MPIAISLQQLAHLRALLPPFCTKEIFVAENI